MVWWSPQGLVSRTSENNSLTCVVGTYADNRSAECQKRDFGTFTSMISKVDYNLSKISSKKCIICEDGKFQNLLTKICEASLVMSFPTVIVSQIKCPKKPIFTNLKKRFERIELPAKLLDYFLRSNKSNINQWAVSSEFLAVVKMLTIDCRCKTSYAHRTNKERNDMNFVFDNDFHEYPAEYFNPKFKSWQCSACRADDHSTVVSLQLGSLPIIVNNA